MFKENSNELNEDFIKSLKAHKFPLDEATIKKLFTSYKKQNEVDFFIHKNARVFLQEQFDLWFYHYLYKDSEFQEWSEKSISHLQRIRNIALEIIGLIGDFEDELKAVWLKPKFAKVVNYVFSLDLILKHSVLSGKAQNTTLLDSICKDKGFEKQIKEWQDLKLIDESFQAQNISENILNDEKYKFLPIDTKHFSKEIKYKILSVFDDIESILNGELIKADNFQALNTLMPKYQNKVDLIYIDPPYNTSNNDFVYMDKFNHSSWLSMIANRLELARDFLKDSGSIFISIDDNEQARLKILCDEVFGEDNFVADFVWQGKYTTSNDAKYASNQNESIFCFAKAVNNFTFNLLARTETMNSAYKNPDNDPKGAWKPTPLHAKSGSENNLYTITFPNGTSWNAPKGRYPRYSKERLMEIYLENGLYFNKNGGIDKKTYLSEVKQGKTIGTFWSYKEVGSTHEGNEDLASILDKGLFDNPKPEKLLKRICEIVSNEDSIILDFFAGSGTSVATAQKLGRKWLGIEMGEHFYKVIIPRLKKVIAGFQSGISKECDYKGSGAFRYYELESYEEALKECEYVLMDSEYTKPFSCHTKAPSFRYYELESYEEALKECEYVLMDSEYTKPFSCHTKAPSTCHTEASAKVSKNIESKRDISLPLNMTSLHSDTTNSQRDISASPQYDKEAQYTATYKDSQSIYPAKDYQKAQKIIDYRKSRKLIKKLNKGETITLDMNGYRKEFDLFHTLANLQGLKIKRLFLDSKGIESCEFDNGDIVSLDQIDLHTYPKLKNLLWWEKL